MDYNYLKTRGWLNEAAVLAAPGAAPYLSPEQSPRSRESSVRQAKLARGGMAAEADGTDTLGHPAATLAGVSNFETAHMADDWLEAPTTPAGPGRAPGSGLEHPTNHEGDAGVFLYTVEEGQRVLMRRPNGTMDVVVGPCTVWRGRNTFKPIAHHIAHPGDYLSVRFRDGHQEHLPGPSEVWFDPRVHHEVRLQEGLQLAAKEAVVVYSAKDGGGPVQRRIVHGPALFVPQPGEWLHTFSWHASRGGSKGVVKVPNGLIFQKLWMMPDQMYHDVSDVRTADDAVLTIRLMMFFELVNIDTMLDSTHDPIGDFVNAASSDVVDFVGRHELETFKRHTDQLNEIATYKQLASRAGQCGYRINKVVYRGYGAPDRLQKMQDEAIEARTRLTLARDTERQGQELRASRLENGVLRASKRRQEQAREAEHAVELERTRLQAELQQGEARTAFQREQARAIDDDAAARDAKRDARRRAHLEGLRDLGVDLNGYVSRSRPDRVIELRGANGSTHVHIPPDAAGRPQADRIG